MAGTALGAARQRAHGEPAYARKHPLTAEGLDAAHVEHQARRLPRHTDPDAIDDPDVREQFLAQLNDEETRPSRDASTGATRRPMRVFSAPDSIGSAVAGGLAFAVLLNFARGGPGQVKKWFAAKLTNGHGSLP